MTSLNPAPVPLALADSADSGSILILILPLQAYRRVSPRVLLYRIPRVFTQFSCRFVHQLFCGFHWTLLRTVQWWIAEIIVLVVKRRRYRISSFHLADDIR